MIDEKETFQQQILFDEVTNSHKSLPEVQQAIVIENEEWQEEESQEFISQTNEFVPSKPNWLLRSAAIVFVGLLGYETVDFFIQGFSQNPFIATGYGVLLALVSMIAGSHVFHEYRGLRQFKKRQKLQQSVEKIFNDESSEDAIALCDKITQQLPCDLLSEEDYQWSKNAQQELTDKEILGLYSRQILSQVDQKALDKVSKYSTEAAILVALSPMAVMDMLLMLWRNTKMINEVAKLYGMNLSYWSRIKLIKETFKNMVYAGASELVTDVCADIIGADVLGKLSGRMAQGLGAGMLTARLGLKAINVSRPMPFNENTPKLKDVRAKVIGQIKQLINKKQP